jgi:hypothetical protein
VRCSIGSFGFHTMGFSSPSTVLLLLLLLLLLVLDAVSLR